jgi:2-keto-3-deoxy-L-rhamnonate aldolase RhmA
MNFHNAARQKLAEGQLALGFGVRLTPGVEISIAARTAGYDWLFIDLEHGAMSLESASQLSIAALGAGITPIVRVAKDALSEGVRLLDNGAQGIIVPHMDTAQEAREVATRFRYPPGGQRSVTMSLPFFGYGPVAASSVASRLDPETLVIGMIESREALDNIDEIAAVPGIDVLLVGSQDLSLDLGIPPDGDRMRAAYSRVASSCAAHGKWVGMAGISDRTTVAHCLRLGVRFVLGAMDVALLVAAAGERSRQWREAIEQSA